MSFKVILKNQMGFEDTQIKDIKDFMKKTNLSEDKMRLWLSNFNSFKNNPKFNYVNLNNLLLKILKNFTYYSSDTIKDIIEGYKTTAEQIFKNYDNIYLVTPDDLADSASRYVYDIFKTWSSEKTIEPIIKNELTDDLKNNEKNFFIFFNDTHGTGKQFIKEFDKIVKDIKKRCAIFSIVITQMAIDNFKKKFPDLYNIYPTTPQRTVFNIFDSNEIKALRTIGAELCDDEHALGYKNSGLLIAYHYQCPNNTLPIIWYNKDNYIKENKQYPWNPLFEYKSIKNKKSKKGNDSKNKDKGESGDLKKKR